MSEKLSFREAAGQRGNAKAPFRDPSAFPVEITVSLDGDFDRPIDFMKLLRRNGLTLREAFEVLNILTDTGVYTSVVYASDDVALDLDFKNLNLISNVKTLNPLL